MKTAAGSPSLAGTDDRVANSDQPAGSVPDSHPAGPLEELDALAHEIADELSQGEWVPSRNLYRYRALKRKLAE